MMNILRFFVMTLNILVRVCLTSDYNYIGCYFDDMKRILRTAEFKENNQMSVEICHGKCTNNAQTKNTHFGTEYGKECFCGNDAYMNNDVYARKENFECNMTCRGHPLEKCGGIWRISIYAVTSRSTTPSTTTKNPKTTTETSPKVISTRSKIQTTTETSTVSVTHIPAETSATTLSNVQKEVTVQKSQMSAVELGAAVGVPILFLIILVLGFLIYRKLRSKPINNDVKQTVDFTDSHDCTRTHTVTPVNDVSASYTELNTYNNSHKYQDLNSTFNSPFKAELSYDYVATPLNAVSKQPHKGINLNTESRHIQNEKKSKEVHEVTYFVLESEQNNSRLPFTESCTKAPSTSYAVLDPKVTGFNRLDKKDIENGYEFSQPISDKRQFPEKTKENGDEYDSCDTMNKRRWDIPGENVYSHTVDDTYDCSSYRKQEDTSGDTYDHFIGEKTEDEYDITKRH